MPTFHVNDDSTIYDDNSVGNSSGINHSKAKGASSVIINGTQKIDDDNVSLGGDSTIVDADDSIEDTFDGSKKKSSSIPTILRGHADDDVSTIKTVHIVEQLILSSINDIFNYFQLPKSSKSCMPSRRDREEELDLKVTNRKKWSQVKPRLKSIYLNCSQTLRNRLGVILSMTELIIILVII